MEKQYRQMWEKEFSARMIAGRILQSFFGSRWLSNVFIGIFKIFPSLTKKIIKQTHGRPF
jgi:hypothetical protein